MEEETDIIKLNGKNSYFDSLMYIGQIYKYFAVQGGEIQCFMEMTANMYNMIKCINTSLTNFLQNLP